MIHKSKFGLTFWPLLCTPSIKNENYSLCFNKVHNMFILGYVFAKNATVMIFFDCLVLNLSFVAGFIHEAIATDFNEGGRRSILE